MKAPLRYYTCASNLNSRIISRTTRSDSVTWKSPASVTVQYACKARGFREENTTNISLSSMTKRFSGLWTDTVAGFIIAQRLISVCVCREQVILMESVSHVQGLSC